MSDVLHLDLTLTLGLHSLIAKADVPLTGITALEGPSGSGKTTLLRVIAGLEPRAKGVIRFGAVDWQSDKIFLPPQNRRIGFVFQDTRLFKHLDVRQNLAYGHQRSGADREVLERVISALELSDMLTRRVGGLSGGEKQRVAIGRALAMDPKVLLMDEPMSGLDLIRKEEILPYIATAVQALGCPAIYVSHERRETSMIADHIMLIADGYLSTPVQCETILQGVVQEIDAGGRLALCVGGQETRLPVNGGVGTRYEVRINENSVVISGQDPGVHTARLGLAARLVSITPDRRDTCRLIIEGEGWRISISKRIAECDAVGLRVGQPVWLIASDVSLRHTAEQTPVAHS